MSVCRLLANEKPSRAKPGISSGFCDDVRSKLGKQKYRNSNSVFLLEITEFRERQSNSVVGDVLHRDRIAHHQFSVGHFGPLEEFDIVYH